MRWRRPSPWSCPVFPATGRTLYMGHLFVKDRLLSESGMETHPLNPMTDPDIRRWLSRQTRLPVGLVPYDGRAPAPTPSGRASASRRGPADASIVADAIVDDDLRAIGEALDGAALVTGGSGIAIGLPANFRAQGLLAGPPPNCPRSPGRVACCPARVRPPRRRRSPPMPPAIRALPSCPDALMAGRMTAETRWASSPSHLASEPMVYSTADPGEVAAAQAEFGREALAHAIESFFARSGRRAGRHGCAPPGRRRRRDLRRGDHRARNSASSRIGPEIDPGVPVLIGGGDPLLGLALKSGNFGAPDFFAKALQALGTP